MSFLSTYFKRSEFACKCGCGFDAVDVELLDVLEYLREHFNRPVVINSACRCEAHNRFVKGAKNSIHVRGKAADVRVQGIEPAEVATYLEQKYPDKYGIGRYPSFTHIDVRAIRSHWEGK